MSPSACFVHPCCSMAGASNLKKVKRYSRTRSGCMTCKKRHLKCDETPGTCNQCRNGKVKCDGYAVPKTWSFLSKPIAERGNHRYNHELKLLLPTGLPGVRGSAVDPFQAAPVPLNHDTTTILQYYITALEPSVAGCWKPGQPVPTKTLFYCFHDELRMQGLLAQTASHMEHSAFLEGANGQTSLRIDNCIKAVKFHIQKHGIPTSALAFAVIHLCGAEGGRHDIDTSMIHLRGARDIISHLGGVHKLDEDVRSIWTGMDIYRAVQLVQKPLLPCFDPGDAVDSLRHLPDIMQSLGRTSRVGCLFNQALSADLQGNSTLQIPIHRLTEALRVWQFAWHNDAEDPGVWRWLLRRFQAINHAMLSIQFDDAYRETLRVTMIMWNTMVRTKWGAHKVVKSAIPHLRDCLQKFEWFGHWQSLPYRQWILSVGAMAAENTNEAQWFRRELKQTLGTGTASEYYENLKSISMDCFYFEPLQARQLWNLAQSIAC